MGICAINLYVIFIYLLLKDIIPLSIKDIRYITYCLLINKRGLLMDIFIYYII